ncbi:complement C3-like isoform X4 [Pagrus major]|uniref:complement C3-like isoform X4 n=1 Tax=Pagrus major TaxID=143350 RepID=UPI003CC8B50F
MGSSCRMCVTQLRLLAFLAFFSLTDGAQLQVMSAPNLLRVGTAENIFVECQDCTGADIRVEIIVMNHPTKTKRLASTIVTLTSGNSFQELAQIMIPVGDFSKDPNIKQYVYLQAQFPDRLLEKVVLASFQSGYIFIQTDKTLYTPESTVLYRMFAVTPLMKPVEEETNTDASIAIEIVTPEGIILPLDPVSLNSGIHSGYYKLGEIVSPGLWKVVAKFHSNPQQSYSAEFEVKEYVFPSFEVKLTPVSPFFYVDSPELTINIRARYLSGEEVDGMAYVIFGVIQEGTKKSFPGSLQRVQIARSMGVVSLRREHITQTFQSIDDLVGSSIFVAVSVLTESGGEMVEAELRGIKIVTSPYTIHFKKTPKYFKPGMAFDVVVEVVNPDETPAQGVAVVVDPGQVRGVTAANGMMRVTINTESRTDRLTITAKTNDPVITRERQALASMTALPYTTKSNNYIHIGVYTAELALGDNLKINLNLNSNQDKDITYLILRRGQLVKKGRYHTRGQVLIPLIVPITKEMLPSFRIIAYYHTNDNEVVSDSVWVDVKDSCMGSLKLESSRSASSYEPRKMFSLKITGDPEATVGLVAVDKGVYVLNNEHRLTQKKVWDIVEKSDTGCTPGGGRDSMSVFYDAGLLFESAASGTPYRHELKCQAPSRKKRAEEDDSYMDSDEIVSRTRFPESWLWSDIKLPACPPQTPNCETTSVRKNVPLQDSITTWQFIGISLSRTHGICVADPLEVIVRKEFFIDLRLPYSAVRGEQIEVKTVLHNISPDPATVRVDLLEEVDVCSSASKRGKYRQEVEVGPQTTRSVPFIIIPMKQGQYRIEVIAAVKDSYFSDGIMKTLRVVPEGVLIKSPKTITLAPANRGVDGKQEVIINSEIPLRDLIPNSPASTMISVTGREPISALVEKEQEYNLYVDILLPERSRPDKFNFNRENHHTTRTSKFNGINKDIKVTAMGSGEATVTMVSLYYALPTQMESECQKFNLSVQLLPDEISEVETTYRLRIEVLYKDNQRDATVSVLDIGLLTGFTVNTNDLNLLSKGRDRVIAKYEMNTLLSERGSLIIYLDKVSHTRPEEITFRIHQTFKVGVLQPAAVSVYEYYDQRPCVKFYHPERRNGKLLRLCRNDECTCAEEDCGKQIKGRISNDERRAKAGEITPASRIDSVFKVRVENFIDGLSTDIYTARIVQVIKEGSGVRLMGKPVTFISHPHCRAALDLRPGKTYLIMGGSKEIHKDEQSRSYQYVPSERTWIEYWPTDAECQTAAYRPTCLGIQDLVQLYALFRCI